MFLRDVIGRRKDILMPKSRLRITSVASCVTRSYFPSSPRIYWPMVRFGLAVDFLGSGSVWFGSALTQAKVGPVRLGAASNAALFGRFYRAFGLVQRLAAII